MGSRLYFWHRFWGRRNLVPVRLDYATGLGVIGGDTVVLKSNRFIACNDASEAYRMSPFGKPEIIWSVRGLPLLADFVEEVGGVTVRDGARSQARVSSFVLRQALGRAAGSALPAF
jgi:hypothetical protein